MEINVFLIIIEINSGSDIRNSGFQSPVLQEFVRSNRTPRIQVIFYSFSCDFKPT